MGFASLDYHRSATQASNQSNPHQFDLLNQHCFRMRLYPGHLRWAVVILFTFLQQQQLNKLRHTLSALFSVAFCVITRVISLSFARDRVNTLLLSLPGRASQFPFITCLPHVLMQLAYSCYLKVSAGKSRRRFAILPLVIALLPLSRLIRVDVQNVRRMFYGLLRNHSPTQVSQSSAIQEIEGEKKIRGLYS